MKKYFTVLLFAFGLSQSHAQVCVYQDIFRGGVTGDAFNPWWRFFDGDFDIHIEPNSTIRNAYLFLSAYNFPEDTIIYLDGIPITMSLAESVGEESLLIQTPGISEYSIKSVMIDVSHIINPNQTTYSLSPMEQPGNLQPGIYCEYYLFVAYENNTLPSVCAAIFANNIQPNPIMTYQFSDLNSMDTLNTVGLAINASNMCDTIMDGSFVAVNNQTIGLIGGQDDGGMVECAGVMGSFYFQNNNLFGLSNDVPNTTMSGTDAIADISDYLSSTTDFSLEFDYQSNFRPQTNPIHQLFLAYTTTCDTFTVQTSNDTTVCFGSPELQLNASGGVKYLWSPSVGLSCDTCANPVFTADSTVFYTVRVWNNDSCSVVRPVHVIVKNERGKAPDVSVSASNCGDSTGIATASVSPSGNVVSWQTVGGTPQSSPILQNLAPGFHTIFYTDINGCQSLDTTIFIPTVNPFTVSFVANPPNGAAPLSVDFVNTSVSASNFEWFINGQFVGNSLTNFVFDTIGLYTVSLVGWQNNMLCIDTISVQIFVFDSLIVTLPNVFTPNGDGVNELLTITTNQDVTYEFSIQNRWGNTMLTGNGALQKSIPQPIWDGNDASDGVYFVLLKFTQIDGKEIKAQGFVQVFGR